jgi:hypothetical protein
MAVEAGGILADEVHVVVVVDVGDAAAVAFAQGDGKRLVPEDRPRVAAGQAVLRGLVSGKAARVGRDIAGGGILDGDVDVPVRRQVVHLTLLI